jgi:hypothetical protein
MTADKPDREDLVHHALSGLPSPRAPRTLLPRVMAAAASMEAERSRPKAATWFTWRREWQAASIAALMLLVAGAAWIWPAASAIADAPLTDAASAFWSEAITVGVSAADAASVTSIVWDSFVRPFVPYLFVWIVLMSAACAGFGAALGRVALGGASHS